MQFFAGQVSRQQQDLGLSVLYGQARQARQETDNEMKKVFVFDFDLTLTDEHTGGVPEQEDYMTGQTVDGLRRVFARIAGLGHPVYINTRGIARSVFAYLDRRFPRVVKTVLGARDENQIARPFGKRWIQMAQFVAARLGVQIDEDNISSLAWAYKKKQYLDEICVRENVRKDQIYFYDDTQINIDFAVMEGYGNSRWIRDGTPGQTIRFVTQVTR